MRASGQLRPVAVTFEFNDTPAMVVRYSVLCARSRLAAPAFSQSSASRPEKVIPVDGIPRKAYGRKRSCWRALRHGADGRGRASPLLWYRGSCRADSSLIMKAPTLCPSRRIPLGFGLLSRENSLYAR
jgi:hypothetical protein